jgi:hypothetical protein
MSPLLLLSSILITLALIFYSLGVWAEYLWGWLRRDEELNGRSDIFIE